MDLDFVEAVDFMGDMIEITDGVIKTKVRRDKKGKVKSLLQGSQDDYEVNNQNVSQNSFDSSKKVIKKQKPEQDEKSQTADKQRKANYEEAKAKNRVRRDPRQNNERLREAIILAEIIGEPRCRSRQSRRTRRV